MHSILKRLVIVALVAGSCIGCDRISKGVARARLEGEHPVSYAGDVVLLEYEENQGVLLGIGATLPEETRFWFFEVTIGLFLAVLLSYVLLGGSIETADMITASLVLGGGFSNLLDRLLYGGAVIDFLTVGIGHLRTAVFNLADAMILAGVVCFALRRLARGAKAIPHT